MCHFSPHALLIPDSHSAASTTYFMIDQNIYMSMKRSLMVLF